MTTDKYDYPYERPGRRDEAERVERAEPQEKTIPGPVNENPNEDEHYVPPGEEGEVLDLPPDVPEWPNDGGDSE
jgi:hypothetical protein